MTLEQDDPNPYLSTEITLDWLIAYQAVRQAAFNRLPLSKDPTEREITTRTAFKTDLAFLRTAINIRQN